MTYNFTVQNVGTYWWHAHYSTQVCLHYAQQSALHHSTNDSLPIKENGRAVWRIDSALTR